MYIIRDRENGNPIDEFSTIEEAENAVKEFYDWDIKEDNFADGFYEIYNEDTGTSETYYYDWDIMER